MANAQQFNLQLCNWKQFITPNELLWLLEGDPPFFHEKKYAISDSIINRPLLL